MKDSIYDYIKSHQSEKTFWKTSEIATAFDLSSYLARYYLTQLCNEGKLQRPQNQRGKAVLWTIPDD
ncbi:FaeA/PapI family transcriptional regulator [Yersinia similis]|nr:FaeA/PapI family transcriptional regulator [Yersinia similis]AHK18444.1 hypothetical protein BF17_03050 [Yersinia similis]